MTDHETGELVIDVFRYDGETIVMPINAVVNASKKASPVIPVHNVGVPVTPVVNLRSPVPLPDITPRKENDERPNWKLMEKEIQYLGAAVADPARPFVAILGGAKISDKIGVISNLLGNVDAILIGGGMAHTFLAAHGLNMAKSLVEAESLGMGKELTAKGDDLIHLPVDLVAADRFADDAKTTP